MDRSSRLCPCCDKIIWYDQKTQHNKDHEGWERSYISNSNSTRKKTHQRLLLSCYPPYFSYCNQRRIGPTTRSTHYGAVQPRNAVEYSLPNIPLQYIRINKILYYNTIQSYAEKCTGTNYTIIKLVLSTLYIIHTHTHTHCAVTGTLSTECTLARWSNKVCVRLRSPR